MPIVKCQCGATTNSALSEYWLRKGGDVANGCYAKWVDGQYIEGCLYATTKNKFMKEIVRKMIASNQKKGDDI